MILQGNGEELKEKKVDESVEEVGTEKENDESCVEEGVAKVVSSVVLGLGLKDVSVVVGVVANHVVEFIPARCEAASDSSGDLFG